MHLIDQKWQKNIYNLIKGFFFLVNGVLSFKY